MQNQTSFVFKQSFIYSIGNSLTKLSGVILIPLYLTYITREELGVVTLFETIFQFILILSSWGVKGGFMRWYHEMRSSLEKKQLFFTTWIFNLLTSLLSVVIVGVLLFMFGSQVFKYELSASILLYFLVGAFFRLLYDVPYYLLKLEQKAGQQTMWTTLNILLLLGFTYYFLEVENAGIIGIYQAQMYAHLLTLLTLIPLIHRNLSPQFLKKVLKEMILYGFPLAISNILSTILTLSDRHIINLYTNLGEVGEYGIAFKVANLVQLVIVASLLTSYSNHFFKTMHEKGSMAYFQNFTKLYVVLLTIGGLAIVLFSPEIIYVISNGADFLKGAVFLVPILIGGLLFSGLRQLFTLPLNKHKKTKIISVILISAAVINIVGNFILVPHYGKTGASVSTLFSELFALVSFVFVVKKIEPVNFPVMYHLFIIVVWGATCYAAMQFFDLPLLTGWLVKILFLLFFIGILVALGMIQKDALSQIRKLFVKQNSKT
jgi:O-antigen/teichoic acid export membrane protein